MSDFLTFVIFTIIIGWLTCLCVQLGIDLSNATEFMLR